MRKENKQSITAPEAARVQNYHERTDRATNYAFQGFKQRKYFTSDRTIALDENYRRADGKPLKGYGLEIETECNKIDDESAYAEVLEKVILSYFPADLFKLQHDGSLGGSSSAECITQPMTKEAIRNLYPTFKLMYNHYFPIFGISCSRSGACGMHVNVSVGCLGRSEEKQADNAKKLLYIINKHYRLMTPLFARDASRVMYCRQMVEYAIMDRAKNADLYHMDTSHGNCCNWSHFPEGRIEIRLVGGQKDYGCFRNTMESVFHLIAKVQELKWTDLDDITKIFSGCNQYVFDRLKTRVHDAGQITTEQLDTIRRTVKREELL